MMFQILFLVCILGIFVLLGALGFFQFWKENTVISRAVQIGSLVFILILTGVSAAGYKIAETQRESEIHIKMIHDEENNAENNAGNGMENDMENGVPEDNTPIAGETEEGAALQTEAETDGQPEETIRIGCSVDYIQNDGNLLAACSKGDLTCEFPKVTIDELGAAFEKEEVDAYLGTLEDLIYCNTEKNLELQAFAVVSRMSRVCIGFCEGYNENSRTKIISKQSMKQGSAGEEILKVAEGRFGKGVALGNLENAENIERIYQEDTLTSFEEGDGNDLIVEDAIVIHTARQKGRRIDDSKVFVDYCSSDVEESGGIFTMKILMIKKDLAEVKATKIKKIQDALKQAYGDIDNGQEAMYRFMTEENEEEIVDSNDESEVLQKVYQNIVTAEDFDPDIFKVDARGSVEDNLRTLMQGMGTSEADAEKASDWLYQTP